MRHLALVRAVVALVVLGACGRIHFRELGPDGSGDGGIDSDGAGPMADAPPPTGPTGARYLIELDANGALPMIAGAGGAVAVAETFQGATTIAGRAFTGKAMYVSSALLWIDPTGAPASASVLDSDSICALRGLGSTAAGTGVIGFGYTESGNTTPAYGPCALATAHQNAIAIGVDAAGGQTFAGRFSSTTMNSQGWYATGFHDGTIALSGIYGDNGKIGSTMLPTAGSDENPYFARIDPATGEARWIQSMISADSIFAGPIDALGDDLCITGAIVNTVTVLGTSMTAIGMSDNFVARLDASGQPRFARLFGSTGAESTTTGISVAATADGGCTVATQAPADLSIDGLALPASQGGTVVIHFDGTGHATVGARAPAGLVIGRLGDALYGAVPCTAPCTIAGAMYTPVGHDIVLLSFDGAIHGTVIGALTGGAMTLDRFATIAPDALAVSFVSGPASTAFGLDALNTPTAVSALAVLGVGP